MFPVRRVGRFFGQHVKSWVLPININAVKSKMIEEMHRAQDKLHSCLLGLRHLRENPATSGPPTNGEENLEFGVDFLQGNGSTHTIVVAVLEAVVCDASWWPGMAVSLLEARFIILTSKYLIKTHFKIFLCINL